LRLFNGGDRRKNEQETTVEFYWHGKNEGTRRKSSPSATLSITNPIWTDPELNPSLRSERPATKRLNHGTAKNIVITELLNNSSEI
jgi:hypothetical protein